MQIQEPEISEKMQNNKSREMTPKNKVATQIIINENSMKDPSMTTIVKFSTILRPDGTQDHDEITVKQLPLESLINQQTPLDKITVDLRGLNGSASQQHLN